MKALTVVPGKPELVRIREIDEPEAATDRLLVQGRLIGVCGTDKDIVEEGYGEVPPGADHLIVGHESLGEVLEAPEGSGFQRGDLVVGIVRRPDPVPCEPCSHGEWDFCRNGRYTERGIKERHGFGAERWQIRPAYAVRVAEELGDCGVLLEPTSVVAKAWEQTDRIFARASWRPRVALITGAGPIGLLAAMIARQRGLEVHVLDRSDRGPRRALVEDLGATFHKGELRSLEFRPDVVIECTGHGPLVFELPGMVSANAVICLMGLSPSPSEVKVDLDAINECFVLKNAVLFGSVNAGRRNYEQAAQALAAAGKSWAERLITRRVPMSGYREALQKGPDDVKVVVELGA